MQTNQNTDVANGDAIQHRADFDFVRYGNCWEDADVLVTALSPEEGKRILSIASAGDNVLALLATGAEVVAADLNPAQLACLELRCAAFRNLQYEDVLAFLGVTTSPDRSRFYRVIERDLTEPVRAYWAQHPTEIRRGIIHLGKFESYFKMFGGRVLPWIHSSKTIEQLWEPKNRTERLRFWEQTWNNRRWRWLLRLFFSRFLMSRMGRDPEFFRYVEGSISDQIRQRAKDAMTELATDSNPYLRYIATGNYSRDALPRYLRWEHFDAIRSGLERLSLFQGPIESAAEVYSRSGFDGFNLSDIFEYVGDATFRSMYQRLCEHANSGARIVYWNAFVPRRCPSELAPRVTADDALADKLFAQDKAFFYSRINVDRVR